jgi:hypothetical protein
VSAIIFWMILYLTPSAIVLAVALWKALGPEMKERGQRHKGLGVATRDPLRD